MAYDSKRGKVVLFGGNERAPGADEGLTGDTWEWDGSEWTKVAATGPAARDHHGMTYDSGRGRVVLFGGWNGAFLGDTWEWDGTRWLSDRRRVRRRVAASPAWRTTAAAAA